jgi:hypothetical protein
MKESRYKKWRRNEREALRKKTPTGRFLKDLPEWQISALKLKPASSKARP